MSDIRIFQIYVSDGGVPKRPLRHTQVTFQGVEGDRHNGTGHGGPQRALCLYSLELVLALQAEGHPIFPGSTEENVTINGMDWTQTAPGKRLRLGEQLDIELTGYAAPCNTIHDSFTAGNYGRISETKYPGWSRLLARVVRPGFIRIGDPVSLG